MHRARRRAAASCLAALLLALAVAAQAPAAPERAASANAAGPRFVFKEYRAPVPPAWAALPPASSFRVAQYRVPAAPGASDGEVVVYYFGQGQGGSVSANIARWTSQFSGSGGQPVTPRVEALRAGSLAATLVELKGSYARQIGMSAGATGQPGQTLLAAVVETPHGNLTFQLHGDQATVAAQRDAFVAMLRAFEGP